MELWLLSPVNILFGLSAGFMNNYVNVTCAVPKLGGSSAGWLGAVTVVAAALGTPLANSLSTASHDGKGVALTVGAACFLVAPVALWETGRCNDWASWLVVLLYVFQGFGRSVYESTNRAVFADFFSGEDADPAFANLMMQFNVANAISNILQTNANHRVLAMVMAPFAAAAPLGFVAARRWRAAKALPPPVESGESVPLRS